MRIFRQLVGENLDADKLLPYLTCQTTHSC
ncbi:hypothetical protein [Beggiatoa alba]